MKQGEQAELTYRSMVADGYAFGLSGLAFPNEPIGSAWAHGFRLGRSELSRVQQCARLGHIGKRRFLTP